jgi:hypothetical protein
LASPVKLKAGYFLQCSVLNEEGSIGKFVNKLSLQYNLSIPLGKIGNESKRLYRQSSDIKDSGNAGSDDNKLFKQLIYVNVFGNDGKEVMLLREQSNEYNESGKTEMEEIELPK